MIMNLVNNRAIYDILFLLLSYPEKKPRLLEQQKHHIDEDDNGDSTENENVEGFYNVVIEVVYDNRYLLKS